MRPLRLIQFTDTHLFADKRGRLCGLDTTDSLLKVLALARGEGWPPDAILATGDLSQDETPQSYARFLEIFDHIGPSVHCLPGNHDIPRRLSEGLSGSATVHLTRWVDLHTWQIIMLNTVVPRDNGGELAGDELEFLDRTLAANPERPALICLHHNPVPVGSLWLDTMKLRNDAAFFSVIDRHPHVRGILWGHIHQEFDSERLGVRLLGTPSTCLQFLPGSRDFAIDRNPPGFRRLDLLPNGRIETQVFRLPSYDFTPDLSTRGY